MKKWRIRTTDANGAERFGDVHEGPGSRRYLEEHAQWAADKISRNRSEYVPVQHEGLKVRVGGLVFEIVEAAADAGPVVEHHVGTRVNFFA